MRTIFLSFRRNGITLGGVEDVEIEGFYTATLQDLKVLTKDLKAIVADVESLKEHETLRKWGDAPVKKEYEQLIGRFNATDLGPGDFDRNSDPLSTPNLLVVGEHRQNYHPAYDRSALVGPNVWDLGQPDSQQQQI